MKVMSNEEAKEILEKEYERKQWLINGVPKNTEVSDEAIQLQRALSLAIFVLEWCGNCDNEWFSVDDRLPTPSEDKKYLVCDNNNLYSVASYEYAGSGDVYFFDYENMRLHNVIAWKKIEPYKENDK